MLGNLNYSTSLLGQVDDTIAIGTGAGNYNQGMDSVAIGTGAGNTNQGMNSVAIGNIAGQTTQGDNAVAIGYMAGMTGQLANTIVLNSSGATLDTSSNFTGKLNVNSSNGGGAGGGLFVAPIKTQDSSSNLFSPGTLVSSLLSDIAYTYMNPLSSLYYDPVRCEISYYSPKWYDLSGQRPITDASGDISYYNNTGRPIIVNMSSNFSANTTSYYEFRLVINSPDYIVCAVINAIEPSISAISVVIPANSYYYLGLVPNVGSGTLVIKSWSELR